MYTDNVYFHFLKIVAKDDTYIVNKYEADAKLTVETTLEEEKFVVNVTLTSPSVREAILSAAEGGKPELLNLTIFESM